jgi:signal transduction histidine kinase/CheY-like chemotaxis protein/HPt (histidine-containing phosphotransfer) domain-containing protein
MSDSSDDPLCLRWHDSCVQDELERCHGRIGTLESLLDVFEEVVIEQSHMLVEARRHAEEASLAKSQFLTNMSHEIRTPLNGVIGMTEVLRGTPLNEQQQNYLRILVSSGESLLLLINDILDLSKIEAGRLQVEEIEFDLQVLVEEALEVLAIRAQEKQLELISFIAPQVPGRVRGDPTRIRQILMNLVGNALKFTDKGEVSLRLIVSEADEDQIRCTFHIEDSGIGICPEVEDRLFRLFEQGDSSTTRRFGGTGLGLAISKRLVALMHGDINFRRRLQGGSHFWFCLPLRVTERCSPPRLKLPLEGLKALAVDDNRINLLVLESYLRDWGAEVVSSRSGRDAYQFLQEAAAAKAPFDLVVSDVKMDATSGVDLVRRSRQNVLLKDTPFILLSSHAGTTTLQEEEDLAGIPTLSKPVRKRILEDTILQVLRKPLQGFSCGGQEAGSQPVLRFQGKVLLVEDNRTNQLLAQIILKRLGLEVITVEDGLAALDSSASESFDLILMDLEMPGIDGYETTRRLRAREQGQGQRTTVVALTAHALEEDRRRCEEAGMDGYLTKPFVLATLQGALQQFLPYQEMPTPRVPLREDAFRFNKLHLPRRVGTDPEILRELLTSFLEDCQALLERLNMAVSSRNIAEVRSGGHALKGLAASIGAARLSELGQRLQSLAVEENLTNAELEVRLIEQEIAWLHDYLDGGKRIP